MDAPPEIAIAPFTPDHISGALRLSQEAGWPHRAEDWALTLGVSNGVVALSGDDVVGTALCSEFGPVAAINMIIVDARIRGQGLGRRVMAPVLEMAGPRELRLTATVDGLPLYEKLGFETTGSIVQYQGIAQAVAPEVPVSVGAKADIDALAEMDFAASGMRRADLLARIAESGTLLQAERGFAFLRPFGRGAVVGPVVAQDIDTARALMSAAAVRSAGTFLRVDLSDPELAAHAQMLGLSHAGGGTTMVRNGAPVPPSDFKTYALASQALG